MRLRIFSALLAGVFLLGSAQESYAALGDIMSKLSGPWFVGTGLRLRGNVTEGSVPILFAERTDERDRIQVDWFTGFSYSVGSNLTYPDGPEPATWMVRFEPSATLWLGDLDEPRVFFGAGYAFHHIIVRGETENFWHGSVLARAGYRWNTEIPIEVAGQANYYPTRLKSEQLGAEPGEKLERWVFSGSVSFVLWN